MQSPELFRRMHLALLRQDVKFPRIHVKWLAHRNETVKKPIIASRGPVVSLTTYGRRIDTVYLTLESIAHGSLLPSRLILWLDDKVALENRPRSLRRLEERGLEIELTANYRSHKKYYPFLQSTDAFETPLVTADDDVIYPRSWLDGLVESFNLDTTAINCYRAHEIRIADGAIAPYSTWKPCRSAKPSFLTFAVGSSGCIYPPSFLRALKAAGSGFQQLCPTADDVWLHVNAVRARFMIRQIRSHQTDLPTLPETQDDALCRTNIILGLNDVQIKNTYRQADIDVLTGSAAPNANAKTLLEPFVLTK